MRLVAFSVIAVTTAYFTGSAQATFGCGFVSDVTCPSCNPVNPDDCYCAGLSNNCRCLKAPGTLQSGTKITCHSGPFNFVQQLPGFICQPSESTVLCSTSSYCMPTDGTLIACSQPPGCALSGGSCSWRQTSTSSQTIWVQTGTECDE